MAFKYYDIQILWYETGDAPIQITFFILKYLFMFDFLHQLD
jgi:hypothetical protein